MPLKNDWLDGHDNVHDTDLNAVADQVNANTTKLDGIEALADVTDAANVDAAGAVMNADTSTASMSFVIDEDSMSTNTATKVPTQQSVKAYVDAHGGGGGGAGVTPQNYGAVGDGVTNDTTAVQDAIDSGDLVYIPPGDYLVGALTIPDGTTIYGNGQESRLLFATASSALVTLTDQSFIQMRDLRLELTSAATGSILVDLSNSFRCLFQNVNFVGQHVDRTVSTFRTQIGVRLRDNCGDNNFVACNIDHLGIGVRTDAIMNYFTGGKISTCYRSIVGGDPTGSTYDAGIALSNMTLGSSAAVTDTHILVEGTANQWWLDNVWMEGCQTGITLGSGANGPINFSLNKVKVAATTQCINIVAAEQTYLSNVYFAADGAATPTELTINATNAIDGFAINVMSSQDYELDSAVFPARWTFARRAGGGGISTKVAVPASSSAPGLPGQWAANGFYLYVCVSTDAWRRVALESY